MPACGSSVVHAPEDAWFVEGFLLEAPNLPEGDVLVSRHPAQAAPYLRAAREASYAAPLASASHDVLRPDLGRGHGIDSVTGPADKLPFHTSGWPATT